MGNTNHIAKEIDMPMNSLKDVYHGQLQDLYSANKQSLDVVVALGRAAKDKELSEALIAGSNGISDGMEKIAEICNAREKPTRGRRSRAKSKKDKHDSGNRQNK